MVKYLAIPTADGTSLTNAKMVEGYTLGGLLNDVGYSVYRLSDTAAQATPVAPLPGAAEISIIEGTGYAGSVYSSTVAGQWYADGNPIVGETGSTLILTLANEGKAIRCGDSNVIETWVPTSLTRSTVFDIRQGVTTADGAVASWQSSGVTVTQETASKQPTLDPDFGVLFGNYGGGVKALRGTGLTDAPEERTAIFYVKPTAAGSSNTIFTGGGNGTYQFRREGSKVISVKAMNGTVYMQTSWTLENNVESILGSRLSRTQSQQLISSNGEVKALKTSVTSYTWNSPTNVATIGSDFTQNSQDFKGYISSGVVVDTEVSDADYSRIEGWLAHTLGKTALLIDAHPYKSAAPRVQ